MGKLFGTDGIRGVANAYPIDVETATAIGKAIAGHFLNDGSISNRHMVIGQDTRLSGDMLAQAVTAGACSAGLNVWHLGVLPTPGIARATITTGALAGVVISASHNPFEDNGIKIFDANGFKLVDDAEAHIEALLFNNQKARLATSQEIGRVKHIEDADKHYIDFLRQSLEALDLRSLTVALDCANGATYKVAPELMNGLGATIIPISCNPDGKNINAQCGSQHPEHLARVVVEKNADLGLAFDGDGDRLIAVDEEGHVLSGDQIMAILARDYLQRGLLKNSRVVATVMSNMGFHVALQKLNIELHTSQVGDRYVMEKMLEKDAILGGEDSGHMIFRDVHTTGDGILAALRLISALQRSGKPLSQLAKVMTLFPQKLINVDVKAKPDFAKIPEISHAIARAEDLLGEKGRVLVRYSGTQNKCRVMVEGPTEEQTDDLCQQIAGTIQRMIG